MKGRIIISLLLVGAVSATILPLAAAYTLEIFGNANLDDAVNESDISYAHDIIAGRVASTELADANRDGSVDEEDITQIEEIINESEESLSLKAFAIYDQSKIVTIPMPVEKIVILNLACAEAIRCLKAEDKVIGIGTSMTEGANKDFFPELSDTA